MPLKRHGPRSWSYLLIVGLVILLASCGGASSANQATNTPTNVAVVETPTAEPSPTQAEPTPTPIPPTPTPVPPTPTPTKPPLPKPTPSPTPKPAPTVVVSITTNMSGSFVFSPASITITAGTTVVWKNNSRAGHTVVANDGSFSSPVISAGGTYSHTFTKAGSVSYYCSIHPYMKGSIAIK